MRAEGGAPQVEVKDAPTEVAILALEPVDVLLQQLEARRRAGGGGMIKIQASERGRARATSAHQSGRWVDWAQPIGMKRMLAVLGSIGRRPEQETDLGFLPGLRHGGGGEICIYIER